MENDLDDARPPPEIQAYCSAGRELYYSCSTYLPPGLSISDGYVTEPGKFKPGKEKSFPGERHGIQFDCYLFAFFYQKTQRCWSGILVIQKFFSERNLSKRY